MKRSAKKPLVAVQNSGFEPMQIRNSLSTLLDAAQAQSNLTSFNPILQNNIYAPLTVNWTLLTYMYKTHGVIQTAIDMPVLDALRGGLEIQSGELDKDDVKELDDFLEEEGILDAVGEGMTWARLFGGGALILNTDQDPETPLNFNRIKKLKIYPASRWEMLTGSGWMPGAMGPGNYAPKESDYFIFYGKRIHNSRVIILSGKAAPYLVRWQLSGWGMSEVERMVEDFNAYIKTKNVLYEILEEAKIDVWKLANLNSQLVSDTGTELTRKRIELTNQLKNFHRAVVLDVEDDFQQKQLTFAGLAEVMKENRVGIASALRIPMTKLFGLSASGFNSGEDDIENYNAMVESEVRQRLRKPLKLVLKLVCARLFGDPELDLDFSFKPLRVMSAVDEEAVKASKQTRILGLYDRALIDSEEAGQCLEKDNLLPIEVRAAQGLLEEHPMPPAGTGGDADGAEGGKGPAPKTGKTQGKKGEDGAD